MSFWKKPLNIAMVVVGGVLVVGVIVLLALAIPKGSPLHLEDAGFQEGAPQWERVDFPLAVCVGTYHANGRLEPTDADVATVGEALSRANSRLADIPFGSPWAFEMVEADEAPCFIDIHVGVPVEEGWLDPGGDSQIAHVGGRAQRCDVVTANTGGAGDLTVQVIYHELGHCLGLRHAEQRNDSNNLMQPTTEATPSGQIPDWFSDHDRRIIRERYGPE